MSSSTSRCQAVLTDYHLYLPLENESQSISWLSALGTSNSYQAKKKENIFMEDIKLALSCITFSYFLILINLIVQLFAGASSGSIIPPNATQLREGAARTHPRTDHLTHGVPVGSLSEQQLELGDNLIDFILSSAGLGEARRRHFNRTPPHSPAPRVLTFPSSPESCQRPVAY